MKTKKYPKILALGTPPVTSIFDEPVEITEKLDGSQFGFGKVDGETIIRSKGREIDEGSLDKLFRPAFEYVKSIEDELPDDFMFYGETLCQPRHSTLAYERIPKNHIALFGMLDMKNGKMASYDEVKEWAEVLDVDVVPLLSTGMSSAEHVMAYFDKENPTMSYLGGQAIEGVVVKNYKEWLYIDQAMPVMAGKFVSEEFKEVHNKDWKKLNTGKGKFEALKSEYTTEARWIKGMMRLKEEGRWTDSLKDIGALINEVRKDIAEECKEEIMLKLWSIHRDEILRATTTGIPQWIKERLLLGEKNVEENTTA